MFCRRGSDDALLRQLYEVRKLHLIPVAVGTHVGDLIIAKPGGETWPVALEDVFGAPSEPLIGQQGAPCGDIEEKLSGRLEAASMIGLLHGIAASFGVAGSAKLAAAYGSARALRVRARAVTSDTLDLGAAGRFFLQPGLRQDQGVYRPDDEIYMIREVLRASKIEVAALDANDKQMRVEAEATGLADASLALSARNEHDTSVVFSSVTPAAFAVRLIRIVADPPDWTIQGVEKAVIMRGGEPNTNDTAPDAIIGDPDDGPLFLKWPD